MFFNDDTQLQNTAQTRSRLGRLLLLLSDEIKAAFVAAGGAVVDGDHGDITVSGGGTTLNIDAGVVGTTELANDSVTFAKIQEFQANRILGTSSTPGNPTELRIGTALTLNGDTLDLADANKGDITLGTQGTTFSINASTVTEAMQVLADNTTGNVSTTKHGYAPKAPNDTTKFLRGDATWAVPTDLDTGITQLTSDVTAGPGSGSQAATIAAGAVTEAKQTLADNTTNDVSTTKHGYVPKAPNDTTKFLRGDASWAVPTATPADLSRVLSSSSTIDANKCRTLGGPIQIEADVVFTVEADAVCGVY